MKRSTDDDRGASSYEEETVFFEQRPPKHSKVDPEDSQETRDGPLFRSSDRSAEGTAWVDRARDSDRQIVRALKSKYDAEQVDRECEEIKRRYLVTYMKKVIEELPLSHEIIDASKSIDDGGDEFLKMYSVAKTCVHSEMQLKKLIAFNSVFDMITHVMGKGLHDRLVTPYLKGVVSRRDLDAAYEAFKDALSSDDGNSSTELHCVAYLIQNEIEKDRPLRISNPIFNRFTQQLKAASKYVTAILQSLASKPLVPPSATSTRQEGDDNSGKKIAVVSESGSESDSPKTMEKESESETEEETENTEYTHENQNSK